MSKVSRRELARYAANQLTLGTALKTTARELAAVLISSRRTAEAGLLVDDIVWELETRGRLGTAKITSAHRLSPALRQQLLKAIKAAIKTDRVEVDEKVDRDVLGGVRIETAVHSWDETVVSRLNSLRKAI